MGSEHAWTKLSDALGPSIEKVNALFKSDHEWLGFTNSAGITKPIVFGIKSVGSDDTILITVERDKGSAASSSGSKDAIFVLSALPEQWEQFFKPMPVSPYHSFWGMFGTNIKQSGVEVLGSEEAFAAFSHFWRRALDLLHDAHCGPIPVDPQPETDEDFIVGRYVYITAPIWGRCKVFYEQSGEGDQDIVFLHTAGSDGRQAHGVMNDARMRKKCNMIAFDLPGHGRSFPSDTHYPGLHSNSEDAYVGCIAGVVKALKLNKPIICGASMAGQVCLAVATRAKEVGAGGTIPLQGCDHIDMEKMWWEQTPYINQALFSPEHVIGLVAPNAPTVNRKLLWHTYSGQAYGMFHGDLDFYYGGWDGRPRMAGINIKECPVYMLTGEYDWSNTPAMSEETAAKIPGAKHTTMRELGHFPMTENPAKFIPYLIEAIEWIQRTRAG